MDLRSPRSWRGGHGVTLTARKPDATKEASTPARGAGRARRGQPRGRGRAGRRGPPRETFGRLDLLVNNAGVGIGAAVGEHRTKYVDMQLDVNLRAIVLFYRECAELLRAAGAEHRNALVVNMASMAGKAPQPWLSVYSATAAVVAYTTAMNKELNAQAEVGGLLPRIRRHGHERVRQGVDPGRGHAADERCRRGLRFRRLSPNCVIPEIVFARPGEAF